MTDEERLQANRRIDRALAKAGVERISRDNVLNKWAASLEQSHIGLFVTLFVDG